MLGKFLRKYFHFTENYDIAVFRLCCLVVDNKGSDRIAILERVLSEVRLTENEKAKLFDVLWKMDY